jgi:hypothetical protein
MGFSIGNINKKKTPHMVFFAHLSNFTKVPFSTIHFGLELFD